MLIKSLISFFLLFNLVVSILAISSNERIEILQRYETEYREHQAQPRTESTVDLVHPSVWKFLEFPEVQYSPNGEPRPVCVTDNLWDAFSVFYRSVGIKLQNGCEAETKCDEPSFRDQYLPVDIDNDKVVVNVAFHVICQSETVCPDNMNMQRVIDQMQTLNDDFNTANVHFELESDNIFFHVNPQYSTISAYGLLPTWYNQIRAVKKLYAYNPSQYLNIFVTGQKQGLMGTLMGIGTFPWDPEALTEYGGLWVNAVYAGDNQRTLSHEAGHNVGLWHSFHGVEEVGQCGSPCYEYPHALDDDAANYVGDFCADTPAQPTNYNCQAPSGNACNGVAWDAYGSSGLLYNIMSYHADDCLESFTLSQAARAGCYLCNSVPSLLDADSCHA